MVRVNIGTGSLVLEQLERAQRDVHGGTNGTIASSGGADFFGEVRVASNSVINVLVRFEFPRGGWKGGTHDLTITATSAVLPATIGGTTPFHSFSIELNPGRTTI